MPPVSLAVETVLFRQSLKLARPCYPCGQGPRPCFLLTRCRNMPADSRAPHHMPVHSNYPPPGPVYAQQPGHPMHHHHPSRQMSTGPPPPMPVGGPHVNGPPMPMGGPPPEAVAQTPVSNGRSHGTPAPPGMSQAARAGKEQQDNMLQQLATANENTWMLIGTQNHVKSLTCQAQSLSRCRTRTGRWKRLRMHYVTTPTRSWD